MSTTRSHTSSAPQQRPTTPAGLDFSAATDVGAGYRNGHREINWRWQNAALFGCQMSEWVWLTAKEREPWRGEPISIFSSRRVPGGRNSFPDAAESKIKAATLAYLEGGFDALWWSLWRPGDESVTAKAAKRERRRAAWWTDCGTVISMLREGIAETAPMERARMAMPNGHETTTTKIVADGECIGFLTDSGDVAPSWEWPWQ